MVFIFLPEYGLCPWKDHQDLLAWKDHQDLLESRMLLNANCAILAALSPACKLFLSDDNINPL
jgi:hypothetical protein